MRKQNPDSFARYINDELSLYYLHDGNINILIRLIDYQINIYNPSINKWFNTGYLVTRQPNQTRSILRAWNTYLKRIYSNEELNINMEVIK